MIALILALAAGEPKVNHKVEINGKTYRVEVKGSTVQVFDKSFHTKRNPEAGARLRAAVKAATGCTIEDAYWEEVHLAGRLSCPPSP